LGGIFFRGINMHKKIIIALTGVWVSGADTAFAGPAVTSVPEPTSLSLLAAGIGVLAVTRYLRGKK
jgi:PEP-CTERM motif